mgnify:CR=1 FL=1
MAIYKNISASGTTTTTLITKEGNRGGAIKKITISNSSSTIEPIVIVFIYDGTNTYTFTRTSIPVGAALVLEDNLSFDKSTYDLKILTYHASGTVDLTVIIK